VLLVDDDDAVRAVSRAMLRELGYDVREAASGAMALRLLEEPERIDLLLTDLVMPSMTGAQLAHAARARRPALPVVFISGYAGAEALAGPSMPSRLLRKPVRLTELREQIEAALAPISVG
jgi:CheY-like chemotaxis protein